MTHIKPAIVELLEKLRLDYNKRNPSHPISPMNERIKAKYRHRMKPYI